MAPTAIYVDGRGLVGGARVRHDGNLSEIGLVVGFVRICVRIGRREYTIILL